MARLASVGFMGRPHMSGRSFGPHHSGSASPIAIHTGRAGLLWDGWGSRISRFFGPCQRGWGSGGSDVRGDRNGDLLKWRGYGYGWVGSPSSDLPCASFEHPGGSATLSAVSAAEARTICAAGTSQMEQFTALCTLLLRKVEEGNAKAAINLAQVAFTVRTDFDLRKRDGLALSHVETVIARLNLEKLKAGANADPERAYAMAVLAGAGHQEAKNWVAQDLLDVGALITCLSSQDRGDAWSARMAVMSLIMQGSMVTLAAMVHAVESGTVGAIAAAVPSVVSARSIQDLAPIAATLRQEPMPPWAVRLETALQTTEPGRVELARVTAMGRSAPRAAAGR